ncbi:cysteine synthase A [Agrococcus sp. ARC_14]|uniref:cysteine synthase A n=1 Tax=Agrococcus sp. ARC_14 TaxID=2919927 RepID=UPI001F06E15C|nr:cysteine synthase A [Agrococcus sp. ARC_14]MCH1883700.1 cysteine synthase A [Agrococcus sp. ARC_14]
MARIFDDITATIGGTPLVRLQRINDSDATVLVKLESFNPAASVKDRIGKAIIDAAEASGDLQPGGTIVEGTSGNTGIALALVGAARGYTVILSMPETMSVERRAILKAYGAQLVLTPGPDGMRGAVERAEQIVSETPGAVLARQFENEANVAVHRETTGPEIWDDTDGAVDIFVAGIGTGGTITGAGNFLKEQKPGLQVVAVEPIDSPLLTQGTAGPHKIQGLGANFVPAILDREVYDEVIDVTLDDSIATARDLAAREGIFAGISAGAAVWSALQVARRPESAGKTIVTIVPDTGERYLSMPIYADLV